MDIFTFARKKREADAETQVANPTEESQPSQSGSKTMTQAEFLYGPEGMTRKTKPRGQPPASMKP